MRYFLNIPFLNIKLFKIITLKKPYSLIDKIKLSFIKKRYYKGIKF